MGNARPATQLSRSTTACQAAGWASSTTASLISDVASAARAAPATTPPSIRNRRVARAPSATSAGAATAAIWARPIAADRAGPGSRPTARTRSACIPASVSVATTASSTPKVATASPTRPPGTSIATQRCTGRGRSWTTTPAASDRGPASAPAAVFAAVFAVVFAPPTSTIGDGLSHGSCG